jgi:hypothetical protein
MGWDLPEDQPGQSAVPHLRIGPISLVAAEIHLGHSPAGICDGWLHRNIQIACQPELLKMSIVFSPLGEWPAMDEAEFTAKFEQSA